MVTNHTIAEPANRKTPGEVLRYLRKRQAAVARQRVSLPDTQRRIGVTSEACEYAIGAALADLQHDIDALSAEASCRR